MSVQRVGTSLFTLSDYTRRTIPGICKLQASAGSRTIPILEVIRADDDIESHLHTDVGSMPWIPSTQRGSDRDRGAQ